MQPIIRSEKLSQVHSDIRGPVYVEAMKMIAEGTPVLRLNTGNPATFGFTMPPSVRHALLENADKAVGYCDFRGMPARPVRPFWSTKPARASRASPSMISSSAMASARWLSSPSPPCSITMMRSCSPVPATPCGPMSPSSPGPSRCSTPAMKPPTGTPMSRISAARSPPAPAPSSSSIPITPLARCTPANCWSRLWRSPGKGTYPPLG